MKLTPYESKNLVFLDTEFSDLDPDKGRLLSVGMVKLSGEELYLELRHSGHSSDWVKKHILPMLTQPKVSKRGAAESIKTFLGQRNPFAVAFVDNHDIIYLTKLFGHDKLPFRWMTVDFASVLFAAGINPVKFLADEKGARHFYRKLGINLGAYRQHHALDDARLLRDVWLKLFSENR